MSRGIERDRLDEDPPEGTDVPARLTAAERRVAVAVTRGLTNQEAAAELGVSPRTVDAHLRAVYPKLGVRSRTELAVLVVRHPERLDGSDTSEGASAAAG